MGSPWVYAAADGSGAELAPGLPSLGDLAGTYYDGPSLPEPVAAFGVLGDRASESIGPRVFNRIFHRLRIPALYVPVTTPRLAGLREFMKVLGIRGLSVTTPHKEAVVQAADRLHGLVTRIGASNTLVAEDGGVVAYNTDYHGVLEPVRDACKGQPPKGIACVLGVGGAGRAAACAMQDLGFEVRMWSRRPDRLRAVAGELGVHPMVDGLIPRVIINATPAGGSGAPSVLPDGPFTLAANQVVLEMNYRTDGTPFEHAARAAGASVIPGSVMYASQARWQLHHFWAGLGDVRELMAESVQWAMDGAASC
jgi:shikimate 5-dehydrogenase